MIKHIRYLSDSKPVCEKPTRLGYDFVVVGTHFGPSCRVCNDLLFAHNLREYEKEAREAVIHRTEPPKTKSSIDKDNVVLLVLLLATLLYLGYLTKGFGWFA